MGGVMEGSTSPVCVRRGCAGAASPLFRVLHATRISVCYHLSRTHMAVDCRHCLSFASRVPCASITTTTTHPRVLFDEFASHLHLSFACRVRRGYHQLEFVCNLR